MDIKLLCTFIVICTACIIITLERLFPYIKGQKFFREGFFNDFVLYTIVQSFVLGYIITAIIEYVDYNTGFSRYKFAAGFPLWLQVIFFFLLHDFYIYWFHRLQHNSKILWRIHEAHHSVKDIDWLAGSRSHVLEILINQTVEFAPIVLLGASSEVAVIKGTIDAAWGMYIHSNINVHTGKLQYFLNGPEMHRWHHADKDNNAFNKNFSTKLAVWDWLFNTAYLPENKKPQFYGLSYLKFPSNYLKQQLHAFRKKD
jgi:sterol desaturase/sphingolipid hydroxylase (fatty acid hydroxylase superfamily)